MQERETSKERREGTQGSTRNILMLARHLFRIVLLNFLSSARLLSNGQHFPFLFLSATWQNTQVMVYHENKISMREERMEGKIGNVKISVVSVSIFT